jgi:hypothetical protein
MLTVLEYGCASRPQITAARYGFARCRDFNCDLCDLSNNRYCVFRRMKKPPRASRAAFSWAGAFMLLCKKMPRFLYFLPCGKASFWL